MASGIVLYAMLCGYFPFEDDNDKLLYTKITEGKYTIPQYISKEGKSMIRRLLTVNPQLRITIKQIKRHPWFNLIRQDTNINEGLLISLNVIPVDENIVNEMQTFNYAKDEIREAVVLNKHNHITLTYYLLLKKKIRDGISSISDLQSKAFHSYVSNENNLLSKYDNDIELVMKERKYSKKELILNDKTKDIETSEITKVNSAIQDFPLQNKSSLPSSKSKSKKKIIRAYSVKNSVKCSPKPIFVKKAEAKNTKDENSMKRHSMCISERIQFDV